MTAPDPGLTDLIAAALGDKIMHTNGSGDRNRAYATHVALVVEQHTIGRIAELEAHAEYMGRELPNVAARIASLTARAEKAEATIARVEAAYNAVAIYRVDHELYGDDAYDNLETIDRQSIRAALEGEQR